MTRNASTTPHVLIIVQNLPVPLDRRVWLECQALIARGYRVSVICPKGPGDPARQHIDGVDIYKYPPAPEAEGLARVRLGVRLQLAAHGVAVAAGPAQPAVRRHPGLQPAGHLLAAGAAVAAVRGQVRLRPPRPEPRAVPLPLRRAPRRVAGGWSTAACVWLERRTFRAADRVISTNESYKAIAVAARTPPTGRRDGGAQRTGHPADAPDLSRTTTSRRRDQPGLPRHHGPAGRRRPGAARRRRARAPARPHRT